MTNWVIEPNLGGTSYEKRKNHPPQLSAGPSRLLGGGRSYRLQGFGCTRQQCFCRTGSNILYFIARVLPCHISGICCFRCHFFRFLFHFRLILSWRRGRINIHFRCSICQICFCFRSQNCLCIRLFRILIKVNQILLFCF